MRPIILKLLVVVAFFIGLTAPRALHACAVCIELPEASLADHILSAKVVVLAGPTSDNPFRFASKEIVKGTESELKSLPEIPFLINSVTRRAFRSDPTKTVLLTYGATYKDNAGRSLSRGWKRIFMMNPERRDFVEKLRTSGAHWTYGTTDAADRVSFFAEYLWHPDLRLHNTALVEIGRAPYELVREAGIHVSTSQIMQEFNNLNRFRYVPVAIRLLGLQTDPQALSIIRSRYKRAVKDGSPFALQWALAGIEADGTFAISVISRAIRAPEMRLEYKQSLILALSKAGSFQPKFRDQLLRILSDALERDHRLAAQIAITTRSWRRQDLHPQFEALFADNRTDPATQFVLNTVLHSEVITD